MSDDGQVPIVYRSLKNVTETGNDYITTSHDVFRKKNIPMKRLRFGINVTVIALALYARPYAQDSHEVGTPPDTAAVQPDSAPAVRQETVQPDSVVSRKSVSTDTVAVNDTLPPGTDSAMPEADAAVSEVDSTVTAADSILPETDTVVTGTDSIVPETVTTVVADTVDSTAGVDTVAAADTATAGPPDVVAAPEVKKDNILELDKDVVVGYGTMKKEDLTGSVVSVKSEEIARDAVFDIRDALQGKAAGVNVRQNSGAPGKKPTVHVRGVGTINNSDPLYIVDGVPVNNIEYLNPNDIESVSILKDASATAIYGSRGANGVVMVTTKKAKEGTSSITYDMSIGTQQMWKKPSLCNAEQWAMLHNEAMRAANLPVEEELEDPSSLGKGTDWLEEIINKNALIHQENISVARGTDKLKYFLSVGYFNQEGIIKGSDHRKVTLRFNTENTIADWISLGNTFGLARSYTNYADESDEWNSVLVNAIASDPVTKPRDREGKLLASDFNNMKNPVGIIENTNCSAKKTVFSGTLFSTVDVFHMVEFKSTFGLDMAFNDSSAFEPKYHISSNDSREEQVVTRKPGTDRTWDFENTLNYDTYLFEDHSVKLLAGAGLQDHELDTVMARGRDTPDNDPEFRFLDATSTSSIPEVAGLTVSNSLESFFGRLEYDYLDKYLLTVTGRADGSSRFGPGNKWGYFPSVAGAWKIANEPFMSDVTFIEGLKLRGGWGRVGNQEIPDYLFTTTTSDGQDYPLGGSITPGTTFLSSGNEDIHWETQESTNAGFDISAFGGRIELLGDLFIKKTKDMLLEVPIPTMAGQNKPTVVNAGSLENRGVEVVLNYRESVGRFLSNIGINFTAYRNEVTNLGREDGVIMDAAFKNAGMVTRTEVGHPVGCFYGYRTDGLFQDWEEVNSHTYVDEKDGTTKLVQPDAAPGDIRYRDEDHDGEKDEGYIGSPHPDFIVGMNADVSYRGFDLKVGLQGVFGNEIFNGTRWYTEDGTGYYNLDTKMLGRWTGEGTTNDVNFPRMNNGDANNRMISDRYIEDGSYLRLKTVQLGYSLDESFLRRFRIKRCRLYVGVENLLTITRYSGLEPEVGVSEARGETRNSSLTLGVDRTTYPQTRTYLAGLNITL